MSKTIYGSLVIFALALASRVGYILVFQTYGNIKAAEMERAAASLADTGVLGNVYDDDSGPSAHVAPLYALLLAAVYKVFGSSTLAGRLAQGILASVGTAAGLALLPVVARKARLAPASGWVAAVVMAVHPYNLWNETSGSWEQPFAAVALLTLLLTFLALRDGRWQSPRLVLNAGVLMGVAALLSPTLLPAGALMLLTELIAHPDCRRRILFASSVLAVLVVLFVAPWTYRNYRVLGGFVPLRSNFGLELDIGNNSQANGKSFDTSWEDPGSIVGRTHPYTCPAERERLRERGELAYMRERSDAAVRWIRQHPGDFAALTVRRAVLFWFPPPDMWSPSTSAKQLRAWVYGLLGMGTLGGVLVLIVTRHPSCWLLAAALLGASVLYFITHVDPRYRYPVFGLSTLLACDLAVRGALTLATVFRGRWSLGPISARVSPSMPIR